MNESVGLAGDAGVDAELVDLDRADVPHLLGRRLGLRRAARRVLHEALPTRSPLNAAGPEVTLKVALTLAPGATGPLNVFDVPLPPETTEVHAPGTERLSVTPATGAPVVFVNVTVVSCDDPGENVCSPGGVAVAEGGRQAQPRHVVPGSHDVGLHQLVGRVGRERARGRHRAFVEGALRTDAVVAAVAQEDGPLLAHRVVAACRS